MVYCLNGVTGNLGTYIGRLPGTWLWWLPVETAHVPVIAALAVLLWIPCIRATNFTLFCCSPRTYAGYLHPKIRCAEENVSAVRVWEAYESSWGETAFSDMTLLQTSLFWATVLDGHFNTIGLFVGPSGRRHTLHSADSRPIFSSRRTIASD